MIELTQPQHDELQHHRDSRVRIIDPADQQEYVLVPLPIFERLENLVERAEDEAVHEAWLELSHSNAAGWIRDNQF